MKPKSTNKLEKKGKIISDKLIPFAVITRADVTSGIRGRGKKTPEGKERYFIHSISPRLFYYRVLLTPAGQAATLKSK